MVVVGVEHIFVLKIKQNLTPVVAVRVLGFAALQLILRWNLKLGKSFHTFLLNVLLYVIVAPQLTEYLNFTIIQRIR